jgi:hypothetical protein
LIVKPIHPPQGQFSSRFNWLSLLDQSMVALVVLGAMFLIGWGCWAYLGFHWAISLCVGLVGGFGLGIFWFLLAIREMEKSEEQNGLGLE